MKTALITGGTSGIGFGAAKSLVRDAGYDGLLLVYRADDASASASSNSLLSTFPHIRVVVFKGDLTKASTFDRLRSTVASEFEGRLSAILSNAGLYLEAKEKAKTGTRFTDLEDYDEYQDVYPKAFVRLMETCLPFIPLPPSPFPRHPVGFVVVTSSPGCNSTRGPEVDYMLPGCGKAGLESLTRHYAKTLAERGIVVNCVIPGYTRTKPWKPIVEMLGGEEAFLERVVKQRTPMGRWGDPDEIGDVIAFLCSDSASFINGATIPVDGGFGLTC